MSFLIPPTTGLTADTIGYTKAFERNLLYGSWLQDGVTFTSKYKIGPAGQIYVHKLKSAGETEPNLPGRDFTFTNASDELIHISLNNSFQEGDKAYRAAIESIGVDVQAALIENVAAKIQGGYNQSALAALVTEGTQTTGSALTEANIKSELIKARTELVKKKARGTTVLCSPDTFGLILSAAGAAFSPTINDEMLKSGTVGRWLGLTFIEVPGLSATSAKYYNSAGTLKTATFSGVDFVIYDYDAFSVVSNLELIQIVSGLPLFNGVIAEAEMNVGYKVTNADRVAVRKTT